jgi:hypothetical protein
MAFQKRHQLLFESHLLVVSLLIANVLDQLVILGSADAECGVSSLPRKESALRESFMDPSGGIRFHGIDDLSQAYR